MSILYGGSMEKREALLALRKDLQMNRREFAEYFQIPYRTVQEWELGHREMPEYLLRLMYYRGKFEQLMYYRKVQQTGKGTVSIVQDENGKSVVIINDIRFKGKRKINWDEVEIYLKEYVGNCYEIAESSEKVYIGSDFPDEFAKAKDAMILNGTNAKAKANAAQAIGELVQIATNRTQAIDYNEKHKSKAKYGWYRYNVRFGLPVYSQEGILERYNIFSARMLVRHDADGKLYLYDILRTKKETSTPSEQLSFTVEKPVS